MLAHILSDQAVHLAREAGLGQRLAVGEEAVARHLRLRHAHVQVLLLPASQREYWCSVQRSGDTLTHAMSKA